MSGMTRAPVRWFRSLRYRMTAVMLFASGVFGVVVWIVGQYEITRALQEQSETTSVELISLHAEALDSYAESKRLALLHAQLEDLLATHPRWVSLAVLERGARVAEVSSDASMPARRTSRIEVPLSADQGRTLEAVLVLDHERALARAVIAKLAYALAILTVLGNAVALMLGIWLSKPLEEMSRRVREIGQGKQEVRLEVPTVDDELALLARALNTTFDQLQTAQAQLAARHRELVELEKLAAVGSLAAGVAHEVANPIAGVSGCVRRLARDDLAPERRERYAALAVEGLTRAGEVLRGLLAYANPGSSSLEHFEVNSMVDRLCDLVQAGAKKPVVHQDSGPIEVEWPRSQVEMVLTNLLLNAASFAETQVTASCVRQGPWVVIEVCDDGPGVPDEIRDRVFEPFFTTREPGHGTGLGLAVSLSIARAFGGWIELNPRPDGRSGTIARLRLPIAIHDKEAHVA